VLDDAPDWAVVAWLVEQGYRLVGEAAPGGAAAGRDETQ
jgi:hypothetical protein